MLYVDFPLELPQVLPDPKWRIAVQPDQTVLLCQGRSWRDPADGKLKHPQRPAIGKLADRDGKTVFLPNERFFEIFTAVKRPPA